MTDTHKRPPYIVALEGYKKNLPRLLLMLLFQIALRLISLMPVLFTLNGGRLPYLGETYTPIVSVGVTALLYLFLVNPFRVWGASVLCSCVSRSKRKLNVTQPHYKKWMRLSHRRLAYVLPWTLPLIAISVFIYVWFNVLPFTQAGLIITDIGAIFGGRYETGAVAVGVAFVACVLLTAFGWWLNLALDYQPVVELGTRRSVERAKDGREQAWRDLIKTTGLNLLLSIPAMIGYAVILYLIAKEGLLDRLTGNMKMDLQVAAQFIKTTLTTGNVSSLTVWLTVGCELILHLPFYLWRKLNHAVVVQRICRRRDGMRYVDTRA